LTGLLALALASGEVVVLARFEAELPAESPDKDCGESGEATGELLVAAAAGEDMVMPGTG
jgi:hypothetical protein